MRRPEQALQKAAIGRKSRNKGANGEREVITELTLHLGMKFSRNLKQYQEAQHGDIDAPEEFPFTIEVKRRAAGWKCPRDWEKQAEAASKHTGKYPCVAYRFDRQAWRYRIAFTALEEVFDGSYPYSREHWADLNIYGFAFVCREIMAGRAS